MRFGYLVLDLKFQACRRPFVGAQASGDAHALRRGVSSILKTTNLGRTNQSHSGKLSTTSTDSGLSYHLETHFYPQFKSSNPRRYRFTTRTIKDCLLLGGADVQNPCHKSGKQFLIALITLQKRFWYERQVSSCPGTGDVQLVACFRIDVSKTSGIPSLHIAWT